MKLCECHIENKKIPRSYRFAVISDLHGCDPSEAITLLEEAKPDMIFAPGDIFELVDGSSARMNEMNEAGFLLLSQAAKIAPTFYSMGNHEIGGTRSWAMGLRIVRPSRAEWSEQNLRRLKDSGAHLLDDSYILFGGLAIGGLSSGILNDGGAPKLSWLDEFCRAGMPKILLCHHPEYYEKHLEKYDLDLIVSGHAHGGQWRFFGRGVFSPGQGIFPKYTSGVYDNSLAVSRGMKEGGIIPRIFNPAEVLLISIN